MYLKGKVVSPIKGKPRQGGVLWYKTELPENVYRGHIVVISNLVTLDEVFHARGAKALIAERGLFTSPGAVLARILKIPVVVLEAARTILREHMWLQIEAHGGILVSLRDAQKDKHGERFHPHLVKGWLIVRPRRHSVLRSSMAREAVRLASKILTGDKQLVEYREDGLGYWYKNFPTPVQLLDCALKHPAWFIKKLQERRRAITATQRYIRTAQRVLKGRKASPHQLYQLLEKARETFKTIRPYTDFTNFIMDEELRRFKAFLQRDFLPDQVGMAVSIATHSRYFEELIARGITPPRRTHEFIFPVDLLPAVFLPPLIFKVRYNKLPPALAVMYQLSSKEEQAECLRHLQWTALGSDLSEESDYTYRLLTNVFNYLLQEIARLLQRRGLIRRPAEILDMSIDELSLEVKNLLS